ncbi:uncharacterized protein LOC135112358 isoform X4 [Scylla paramamosain]|uniref:uncharacterized protein LOC135112358 isoform X4 n=1 Tax=Scylla paramamosain TaxID=85552 RepID=UPI0030830CF8
MCLPSPVSMLAAAGCRAVQSWAWAWLPSIASGQRRTAVASVGQQHSRRYSVPTSHSTSEPRWRYKIDSYVRKIAAKVETGGITVTTAITLNTARPVTPDLCQDVLMHICRKEEALRICFRERDGDLWVADMDTPKIDFQVVEGGNIKDVAKITSHSAYSKVEGPLWRARLVVCPPDEPCMLPQVKEAFPYQYHLVIDMHHAVFDGLCNMMVSELFFQTLDSMLDGAQLDDRQIGEFRDRSEVRAAEARIRESLQKDPRRLKALLEERYKIMTRVPLITEAFGERKESPPDTNTLRPEILDHKLLQVFNAKCKAHKVTFNSGFLGVMNVALMELVREAGVVRDSYVISTCHPVSTRRYMRGVTSMVWGFHSLPMSMDTVMPWNARNNFWKHVVDIDTNFRERIRKMGPVEQLVLDTMLQPMIKDRGNKTIYDMALTNTYSPTIKTIGNGKHVQISQFHGYSSVNGLEYKMLFGIFGLKNWVQSQLGYSTTKEIAAKLSEKTITVFNDTAKSLD